MEGHLTARGYTATDFRRATCKCDGTVSTLCVPPHCLLCVSLGTWPWATTSLAMLYAMRGGEGVAYHVYGLVVPYLGTPPRPGGFLGLCHSTR